MTTTRLNFPVLARGAHPLAPPGILSPESPSGPLWRNLNNLRPVNGELRRREAARAKSGGLPTFLDDRDQYVHLLYDCFPNTGIPRRDRRKTVTSKVADEAVNNSTTLITDVELAVALPKNETVQFEAKLFYRGSATADIKFQFNPPSGATMRWAPAGSVRIAGGDALIVPPSLTAGAAVWGAHPTEVRMAHLVGEVVTGSTAGSLALQWAQQVADPSDTEVLARSHLEVTF